MGRLIKKGNFRFFIESSAWSVSLCFRSLGIADILWEYIQDILGSILLAMPLLKLDTLLSPCITFLFVFHAHSPFH